MSRACGMKEGRAWRGVIHEYASFLPVTAATPRITLQEGGTRLICSPSLSELVGPGARVYLKHEGLNPTGSFKDRGMTVAVSKAVEEGARAIMCASTGNTSASAAAYAARAGLKAIVLIPEGKIALGKLSQALIHGATVLPVQGNFDAALRLVRELTERYGIALVNSLNPYRMDGQKTAAFEICDELGGAPDYHFLPVGNAGNITAYWWGFREYHQKGLVAGRPRMMGFQAAGAAPLVEGHPIEHPETVATAIRIGNPARWSDAMNAVTESNGIIRAVTDEEILAAYQELSAREGLFCEPASAASVAGVMKVAGEGFFGEEPATVVCTLTGHGLKDPDRAVSLAEEPETAPADLKVIVGMLGLG